LCLLGSRIHDANGNQAMLTQPISELGKIDRAGLGQPGEIDDDRCIAVEVRGLGQAVHEAPEKVGRPKIDRLQDKQGEGASFEAEWVERRVSGRI